MCFGIGGIPPQRRSQFPDCFNEAALLHESRAEVFACRGTVWVVLQCYLELHDRLINATLFQESHAKVAVCCGMVGGDPQGRIEFLDRVIDAALHQ